MPRCVLAGKGGALALPPSREEPDEGMRDPFLSSVARTIARRKLLREHDSVLVAVSGGPDSVALLVALTELERDGWRIAVGHVNHRLRGRDSERDQRFVERLAARLGCPAYVADGALAGGGNLEERARTRRYELLSQIARRERFRRVATAHTLDDQAETVLLRMARGSGLTGLAAMARETPLVGEMGQTRDASSRHAGGPLLLVRPLLDLPKARLIATLEVTRLKLEFA